MLCAAPVGDLQMINRPNCIKIYVVDVVCFVTLLATTAGLFELILVGSMIWNTAVKVHKHVLIHSKLLKGK